MMKKYLLKIVESVSIFIFILLPAAASAHENYVLPKADIDRGMKDWSLNVFSALKDPHNLQTCLLVGVPVLIVLIFYYWFTRSRAGAWFDQKLKTLEPIGHVILRLALGASFLASAYFHKFLGPEIPLSSLPLGLLLLPVLYITGIMIILGLFTEFAGAIGLIILLLMTWVYKDYVLTYFNYAGEFLALIFFGSRIFSFDKLISKTSALVKRYKNWEIPIIRVTYGISVLYPAISIKLLHPIIIVEIVNKFGLNNIHWLFPRDPLMISLGTGLAQIVVGLFIIFGFMTRLSAFITFILYLLSVIFFKEQVWPHYILLALAIYLTINNGGDWTLDNWLAKRFAKSA